MTINVNRRDNEIKVRMILYKRSEPKIDSLKERNVLYIIVPHFFPCCHVSCHTLEPCSQSTVRCLTPYVKVVPKFVQLVVVEPEVLLGDLESVNRLVIAGSVQSVGDKSRVKSFN